MAQKIRIAIAGAGGRSGIHASYVNYPFMQQINHNNFSGFEKESPSVDKIPAFFSKWQGSVT